jgi:hypothetical protein
MEDPALPGGYNRKRQNTQTEEIKLYDSSDSLFPTSLRDAGFPAQTPDNRTHTAHALLLLFQVPAVHRRNRRRNTTPVEFRNQQKNGVDDLRRQVEENDAKSLH